MLKTMSRKIIAGLTALVLLAAATYGLYIMQNRSGTRNELQNGTVRSDVVIGELTQDKERILYKTCLVWGLAKYYHPAILAGGVDWDKALLDELPALLAAPTEAAADELLLQWIRGLGAFSEAPLPQSLAQAEMNQLGVFSPPPLPETLPQAELITICDFGWTEDEALFSEELRDLFAKLRNTNVVERSASYAFYREERSYLVDFSNENYYAQMPEDDAGYRLLSAFRLWNVMQYYYPYLDGMTDMRTLFTETVHDFAAAQTRYAYERAVLRFGAKLRDSHVRVMGADRVISNEFGDYLAPFRYNTDNGRVLVTEILPDYAQKCGVQSGDYILRMNGVAVADLIKSRKELISASSDEALFWPFHAYLFRGKESTMQFEVERDGQILTAETACTKSESALRYSPKEEDIVLLDDNIGYVNAARISFDTVPGIPGRFQNTRGVIFDLRLYPNATLMYGYIPAWLKPEAAPFAFMDQGSGAQPGLYIRYPVITGGEPLPNDLKTYEGKVVVLANDYSLSQSEFVTMSIRSAPNAVVIGTPTNGADGDVTQVPIPGGMSMYFTSLGVYTTEGEPTQRVGVQPDILCEVTPEGLRQGRDELMEAAIAYILS